MEHHHFWVFLDYFIGTILIGIINFRSIIQKTYGKSSFLMGQLTISMAIFNSYFDITRG